MPTIITYYILYQNLIGLKILISNAVGLQIRPNARTLLLAKKRHGVRKKGEKEVWLKRLVVRL